MQEPLDALENRIAELRRAIRSALAAGEQDRVRELRAELRKTERSWDALVTPRGPSRGGPAGTGVAAAGPRAGAPGADAARRPGRAQADRRGALRVLRRAARRVAAG